MVAIFRSKHDWRLPLTITDHSLILWLNICKDRLQHLDLLSSNSEKDWGSVLLCISLAKERSRTRLM